MSAKRVIESFRIVVRTDDGNQLECSGKGDATTGMLTAFRGFNAERRQRFMDELRETHESMLAQEAERAARTES